MTGRLLGLGVVAYVAHRVRNLSYRRVYGYPVRWAVPGELCWRLEHLPVQDWTPEREDANGVGWRVCSWLRSFGYVNRKACERRGYALSPDGRREKAMYG